MREYFASGLYANGLPLGFFTHFGRPTAKNYESIFLTVLRPNGAFDWCATKTWVPSFWRLCDYLPMSVLLTNGATNGIYKNFVRTNDLLHRNFPSNENIFITSLIEFKKYIKNCSIPTSQHIKTWAEWCYATFHFLSYTSTVSIILHSSNSSEKWVLKTNKKYNQNFYS